MYAASKKGEFERHSARKARDQPLLCRALGAMSVFSKPCSAGSTRIRNKCASGLRRSHNHLVTTKRPMPRSWLDAFGLYLPISVPGR